jgi:DNA-binding response OmpR family regulator
MNHRLAKDMRVLVIDDHMLARGYLKYSMEELGFEQIQYIDKVHLALSELHTSHYDLVICSYELKKEQDGYFLYQKYKESNDFKPSTAFVFISADTTPDIVHSIVELQPDDFLAKPFTVRELNKRLTRVLTRKRALKPIYTHIETSQLDMALVEIERFLTEPNNADFYALALKLKGEVLFAKGLFEEAKEFYQAIINVQNFTWAQLGLVRSFIRLNEDDNAEKLILELAFKADSMLAAYDLLAALQIKQKEFSDALETVDVACSVSPRNIERHTMARELSRITHDYENQFEAAKRIVKYAKNSIHDKPELYLNVARSGIDFAMTADPDQTHRLVKQATDYLKQMKSSFPKADVGDQLTIINARVFYLQDEADNAKKLLEQVSETNLEGQSMEALLDKAKAFHDVGLHENALTILDTIAKRCVQDPDQSELFLAYIQQERAEKDAIRTSPKELNSSAVSQYKKGDLDAALETFRQAFTIMPKNPSIALNLLQAAALSIREKGQTPYEKDMIFNCMLTIENGKLNAEQDQRYQRVKEILGDLD